MNSLYPLHSNFVQNANMIRGRQLVLSPTTSTEQPVSHSSLIVTVFAIEILYVLLNVRCHQNFLMRNYYITYEFL